MEGVYGAKGSEDKYQDKYQVMRNGKWWKDSED